MKNILTIIIAVAASVGATKYFETTSDGASVNKESAYERVMRTGTLKCGYNFWPPMVDSDPETGRITGAIPELVEYAAGAVGLKVEWVQQAAWGTFHQDLKNGRFDAMCAGAWETKEAAPYVAYTRPIFYNPVYAYGRVGETRFSDLSTLNDPQYKIATNDGAMTDIIAREDFPKATRISFPQMTHISELLLNVKQYKADVVFNEASTSNEFIKNNPNSIERISDIPHRSFASPLLGTYITEYELIRMFDTVLSEMLLQGTVQRILDKHEPDRAVIVPVAKPYEVH